MKNSEKLFVSIFASLMIGVASLSAQPISTMLLAPEHSIMQEKDRVKIKTEELPEGVKTALSADAYKGWTVVSAYKVKNGEVYEVELKKGDTSQTLKFDKDGKVI